MRQRKMCSFFKKDYSSPVLICSSYFLYSWSEAVAVFALNFAEIYISRTLNAICLPHKNATALHLQVTTQIQCAFKNTNKTSECFFVVFFFLLTQLHEV